MTAADTVPLSVIIPVYNVANHVAATLKSLTTQDPRVEEIIIVDDGSTDETVTVSKEFIAANRLSNIRLIQHGTNKGVSQARNTGLAAATSQYVLFLDGDDQLAEEMTSEFTPIVMGDDLPDVICWRFAQLDERGHDAAKARFWRNKVPDHCSGMRALQEILVSKNHWIGTGSAAFRRNTLLAQGIRFTVDCAFGEDLEVWKALIISRKVSFINKVLVTYLYRVNSVTWQLDAGLNGRDPRRLHHVLAMVRVREALLKSKGSAKPNDEIIGALEWRALRTFMAQLARHAKSHAIVTSTNPLREHRIQAAVKSCLDSRKSAKECLPLAYKLVRVNTQVASLYLFLGSRFPESISRALRHAIRKTRKLSIWFDWVGRS